VSSNEPDGCGCEVNGSEEVARCFVVSGGDGAELLEFGEEVFDEVACFVEFLVVLSLHISICLGRDDGLFSSLFQEVQHPLVGVEALVGDHCFGFESRQQHVGPFQFASLAFSEMKADRVAERIHGGVNLGAQPALAASDGLRFAPFLRAPALCW
jgi:hypothetical protein